MQASSSRSRPEKRFLSTAWRLPRIPEAKDATVEFDKVLLIDSEGQIQLGNPYVKGAVVKATVLDDEAKADKVLVFKKIRRKGFQKLNGHRQKLSKIRIDAIA